jgi:hypothetical protein
MLAGVEILLERMKTNPEEFVEGDYSKWAGVMSNGWDILTEEEQTALKAAHNEAKRDHFTGEVMRVLSGDVEEEPTVAERYYRDKHLMQGSAIISPQSMIDQVKDTLDKQFDEAYARKDTKTMKVTKKLKDAMRK